MLTKIEQLYFYRQYIKRYKREADLYAAAGNRFLRTLSQYKAVSRKISALRIMIMESEIGNKLL